MILDSIFNVDCSLASFGADKTLQLLQCLWSLYLCAKDVHLKRQPFNLGQKVIFKKIKNTVVILTCASVWMFYPNLSSYFV